MPFYTLQVHLQYECAGKKVHEFKGIEYTMDNIRTSQEIWQRGVRIETAPGSFQLISPFAIQQVFLIVQDKKYGL